TALSPNCRRSARARSRCPPDRAWASPCSPTWRGGRACACGARRPRISRLIRDGTTEEERSMATNKKRVLITDSMGKGGAGILRARDDVEVVTFPYAATGADYVAILKQHDGVHAVVLGSTRFGEAELAVAKGMQCVSRTGVGYDAIDIPLM